MNNIKKDGNTLLPTGYNQWRKDIENLIDTAKLKTAISVNMGTLSLYWNIGNLLAELKNRLKISIFLWRKSCASR